MSMGYCTNIDCIDFNRGIEIPWAQATYWEPGYPLIEDCPTCHYELADDAVDVNGIMQAIEDANLNLGRLTNIDDLSMLRVIITEIERQDALARSTQDKPNEPAGLSF